MIIHIDRAAGEVRQALAWWRQLTREDKKRWLKCEATADEIDAMLQSSVLSMREAASFGAIGEAWAAYRAAQGLPTKGRGVSVISTA